ncbi:MAG: RDD family protein [Chloroflexaceae bacterium]|nr:RDD family protein [Chloroflexaceae bacterium]
MNRVQFLMDDRHYYVETPEVVPISYTVAGAASRCLAATVDTLLILLLQIVLGMLALFLGALEQVSAEAGSIVFAVWSLLAFVLVWGYYLFFELLWSGQTPGKRLIGLRVLREGGRPIDFSASAVRNLVRAVDFLPFAYGLGVLVMFADRRARRLGDLAAGTLVVREGLPITLADLTRGAAPVTLPPRAPEAPPTPLVPNLHLLTPADYALAEDFLRRRDRLGPAPRAELAADLAATLRARLGLAATGDPERFIEHLVREYRVMLDS